jgi:hypothetical protein
MTWRNSSILCGQRYLVQKLGNLLSVSHYQVLMISKIIYKIFKVLCNVKFCTFGMFFMFITYSTAYCLVTKLWNHGMYICMYNYHKAIEQLKSCFAWDKLPMFESCYLLY